MSRRWCGAWCSWSGRDRGRELCRFSARRSSSMSANFGRCSCDPYSGKRLLDRSPARFLGEARSRLSPGKEISAWRLVEQGIEIFLDGRGRLGMERHVIPGDEGIAQLVPLLGISDKNLQPSRKTGKNHAVGRIRGGGHAVQFCLPLLRISRGSQILSPRR